MTSGRPLRSWVKALPLLLFVGQLALLPIASPAEGTASWLEEISEAHSVALQCYRFRQETEIYEESGALRETSWREGLLYREGLDWMFLAQSPTQGGFGSYLDGEQQTTCVSDGHVQIECFPDASGRARDVVYPPYTLPKLFRGEVSGFGFSWILRNAEQINVTTEDNFVTHKYFNSEGHVILETLRSLDDPNERALLFYAPNTGQLLYEMELSGGSRAVPENIRIARYRPRSQALHYVYKLTFAPMDSCELLTRRLSVDELTQRVYREDLGLLLNTYDNSELVSQQRMIDGEWVSIEEARRIAEREGDHFFEGPYGEPVRRPEPTSPNLDRARGIGLMGLISGVGGALVLLGGIAWFLRTRRRET